MSTDLPRWERFDRRQRLLRSLGLILGAVVLVASWEALSIRVAELGTAPREVGDLFSRMYPPDVAYTGEIVTPLIETVHIAVVGTILAVLMALPVAYIAAENTTPNAATYALGKFLVSLSRSVNTIVWGLIFVVIFGGGALAGVSAIAVRSIGFCAKLLAEEVEEIDFGQVEAVRATGAGELSVLVYGILPQVKPALAGISVYRWDINVRDSTILGFVGAGGIGRQLFTSVESFDWQAVLTILIAILGIVLVSEAISAAVRRKVR